MNNHDQTILIVDDTKINRVVLRRALEKAGYQVLEADNGFTALEVAEQEAPDLILLDVMMPERDGYETCRLLKNSDLTRYTPVIFVTAMSEVDQILRGFEVGGQDYIAKPFKPAEVLARVAVHLRLRVTEAELRDKNEQLESLATEMTRLSRIDPLTRLNNRRAWVDLLSFEHDRFLRHRKPYSIIVIDVDCFKAYNDCLGHPAGDRCLVSVAEAIGQSCRKIDSVARYGGEEFVVLLPETDDDAGRAMAERVRKAIWNLAIPHPASTASARVTASLGVASCAGESWEDVLRRADEAMYIAKRAGRNMVFSAQGLMLATPAGEEALREETQPSVLIADPEPTSRTVCRGALQRAGYEVLESDSSVAVWEALNDRLPSLLLLEASLGGHQMLRELREQYTVDDLPIVLVSSRASSEDIMAALEAGADEFLSKPIRTAELAMRAQALITARNAHRDLLGEYDLRGDHLRVLSRLVEFCRVVGGSRTVEDVYHHTLSAATDVTGTARAAVLIPDEDRNHLLVADHAGYGQNRLEQVQIPFGEPTLGEVFSTGRTRVATNDDQYAYDLPIQVSGPMLAVPLATTDETLGVLCTAEQLKGIEFTPRQIEHVELIAKVASTVLCHLATQSARLRASDSIMVALAKLAEHRDADTVMHLDRVSVYCTMLAESLREKPRFQATIDADFLQSLARAAPLHDIGKVAIPDRILLSPERLMPDDMRVMRTHATVGANTIQSLLDSAPGVKFLKMAVDIARYHHEWYDGTGYPAGLAGDAIPLAARIVALADVYDALTTQRVYKPAMPHEQARQEIETLSGRQFDPDVVAAFLERAQEFEDCARRLSDAPIAAAK